MIAFTSASIYEMRETRHAGLSEKGIAKRFASAEASVAIQADAKTTNNISNAYPHFSAHNVFETLVTPTPKPTPPPWKPPTPPPLREAMRNRWKFSYALDDPAPGFAVWEDKGNGQNIQLAPGDTQTFQYGKFEITVRLDAIDGYNFAATLRTEKMTVEGRELPAGLLAGDDQSVTYSAMTPGANP